MLVADAEPEGLREPVGALALRGALEPLVIKFGPGGDVLAVPVGVVEAFPAFHLQFFKGVAEVVARQVRGFEGDAARVGHGRAVAREGLGLDDDDAVGAFGTVDGLGGGVLEDGDGLDAVHVHVRDLLQGGFEAVQDEQRGVAGVQVVALEGLGGGREGRGAADLDVGHRVRVGAGGEVLKDDHRRVDDFQRGDDVGVGDLLDLIRGDGLHRTGKTVLPSGEDAGDDRLLQGLGVQLQVDVQPLALGDAGNLELLGLVAHDFHENRGGRREARQDELAVGVREDTELPVQGDDAHAGETFAGFVIDGAAHRPPRRLLGGKGQQRQQGEETGEYNPSQEIPVPHKNRSPFCVSGYT